MAFLINHFMLLTEAFCINRFTVISPKRREKMFLTIAFLQLVVLLGLRGSEVGIDTYLYIKIFHWICAGIDVSYLEAGYRSLMKAVSLFTSETTILLLVVAAITVFFVFKAIEKNSKDIYLSVILYESMMYYYFAFNAMRQAIATSIVFFATGKLAQKKSIQFFLWTVIAALFHKSAIFSVIIWVIYKTRIRYNIKILWFFTLFFGIFALLGNRLTVILGRFIPMYSGYITRMSTGNFLHPIMYIVILWGLSLIEGKDKRSKEVHFETDLYFSILSVGVFLYCISISADAITRLTYYFTVINILLVPLVIQRVRNIQNRRMIRSGVYFFATIYNFMLIYLGAQGIVPYRFFWQ